MRRLRDLFTKGKRSDQELKPLGQEPQVDDDAVIVQPEDRLEDVNPADDQAVIAQELKIAKERVAFSDAKKESSTLGLGNNPGLVILLKQGVITDREKFINFYKDQGNISKLILINKLGEKLLTADPIAAARLKNEVLSRLRGLGYEDRPHAATAPAAPPTDLPRAPGGPGGRGS